MQWCVNYTGGYGENDFTRTLLARGTYTEVELGKFWGVSVYGQTPIWK